MATRGKQLFRDKTNDDATRKFVTPTRVAAAVDDTPGSGARGTRRVVPVSPTSKPLFGTDRGPNLLRPIDATWQPVLTVVLDLDETLVSNRRLDLPQAILRPWSLEVLRALRQLAGVEIVLWTASTDDVALPVVEQLSVHGPIFDDVIVRHPSWFTEPVHTKDLRLLGRHMDRVVIFDNAPNCIKLHSPNSVLIDDFTGQVDPFDHSLVNLFRIVQRLTQGLAVGISVPTSLRRLTEEGYMMKKVSLKLPVEYEALKATWPPLFIPPHGDFHKITVTETHDPWGQQSF
jgi:hypothetical protein